MAEERLEINGRTHAVRVRHSRRRTVGLYLSASGSIEVRAPHRYPRYLIRRFLESRRDWLARSLRRMASLPPPLSWQHGSHCPLLGEPLTLDVVRSGRPGVQHRGDSLRVVLGDGDGSSERVERLVREWFRRAARPVFEQAIAAWWPRLGLGDSRYPPLKLRAMRRRWGSCASHGGINLNLWLLGAPRDCIDYVVAHELCHLREFNHGPGFHRLMDQVQPDWRSREQRLREHERLYPLA
ncbi:M48 family metallopeptidase [Methylonatrum kenyense]|uniref:M48 family metallopeptidase n=1 Tax=Methylonatrum kenyense TaxID=455253 RepID=UPI0020BFA7A6|nr:SprT family zinc-dependent metalloprotease [Methylonatrum kenyense]MCK8515699.1 M48 family metallopeptidase [Methylonatrum kenyense]